MPLTDHQKTVALVMWARWLTYLAVGFFALALTAALGWARIVPHQIAIGVVGCILLIGLGQRILRYIPPEPDSSERDRISPD